LLAHVLHFQRLDRLPVEAEFARHIPDGRGPTTMADVGKTSVNPSSDLEILSGVG
jgi:hypothetical protein